MLTTQRELIEVIRNFSNTITTTPNEEWTLGLARVRLEMLEGYWMDFQSNHLGLISVNEENGGYDRTRNYTDVQQMFERGKAVIYDVQGRLMQRPPTDGSERTERLALAQSHSRLPRINMPEFSGNREEWESFRDLFTAMIHNDAQITNVEKFYYLKTLVKGEAKTALDALQLSDDNYTTAWQTLEERFEHRRILVYSHLGALRNLKPAREESVQGLQTLLDIIRRHRDQLRALHRPVDQWDDWFITMATAVMDPVTRRAWEDELEKLDANHVGDDAPRPGHELASFDGLNKFISSRCRAATAFSLSTPTSTTPRPTSSIPRNSRSYATRFTPTSCAECQAEYYIGHCEVFMGLDPTQKMAKVIQARLCFNCLRAGHSARSCPSRSTCQKCKSPHHTLLHEAVRKRPSSEQEEHGPAKVQKIAAATGERSEPSSESGGSTGSS